MGHGPRAVNVLVDREDRMRFMPNGGDDNERLGAHPRDELCRQGGRLPPRDLRLNVL